MYLKFHKLAIAPFENVPDPRFFYAAEHHREALANLVYALRTRKGMLLMTGDIGTGKTTISQAIYRRASQVATVAMIRNAPTAPKQLLRQIAAAMGLQIPRSADRSEMYHLLETQFTRHADEQRRSVLVMIDEAQALPPAVFDEIRLLSNLETPTTKLLHIVLIGQTELRDMMRSPRMEALRQRLVLAPHLHPLNAQETAEYIQHRLKVASDGIPTVQFTHEAVSALHQVSGGVPRLINVTADNCLLVAYVQSSHTVNSAIVETVTRDLVLSGGDVPSLSLAESTRTAA